MAFQTPQLGLSDLLNRVRAGRLQLPDFQRDWIWDHDHIASLLATVTQDYPMGVLMALQTGGAMRFKSRPLAGITLTGNVEPESLLLDGQQRLTALYQVLRSQGPVESEDGRGNKQRLWYYIDIDEAIAPGVDRGHAIITVPEDRVRRTNFNREIELDLSTQAKEFAQGLFPLRIILDSGATEDWRFAYVGGDSARHETWKKFKSEVVEQVVGYKVPVIELDRSTTRDAVCTVFEKVNTQGVVLSVFELLTATYAGDKTYYDQQGMFFDLRENWHDVRRTLSQYPVLVSNLDDDRDGLQNTEFLQAVCLVATYDARGRFRTSGRPTASCKRKDVLDLPLKDYLRWAPGTVEALRWAAGFLERQCVFRMNDIPYRAQLIPLVAIRTMLGTETEVSETYAKLTQWYWCGVLGEQYGGSTESRFPHDLEGVLSWVGGGPPPDSVRDATFVADRLESLTSRNSAAYKGVLALLLKQGWKDWSLTRGADLAELVEDDRIEVCAVFPRRWCAANGVDQRRRDSVVNKTVLSKRAARSIGNLPPGTYLQTLERDAGLPPAWFDDVISTHLIQPETLRANDFDAFYRERYKKLLRLIEEAGPTVIQAEERQLR